MFKTHILLLLILTFSWSQNINKYKSFYDHYAIGIDGDTIQMANYKGKHLLIVNVASKCGYTSQYQELQDLYDKTKPNLEILGFPSNDFLWQEPGTNSEIKLFCQLNYGVTFHMFEKIHVKGKKKHPIYKWLSNDNENGWNNKTPSWNFYKYLINANGELINVFPSKINPLDSSITNLIYSAELKTN
jgi:glutathione peroxidase